MKKHIIICCIILLLLTSSFIGVSKQIENNKEKSIIENYNKYLYPEYYDCYNVDEILDFIKYQNTDVSLDNENSKSSESNPEQLILPLDGPMDSPWPMYCHDTRHTGRSPYSTVDNPLVEKWRFAADDWVRGGIAIDNDGILYFGDCDFYIYAVYPNGTEKWRYKTIGWITSTPLIDAVAKVKIRPVVCRQERVGVGIADGFSRISNGRRIGVFAMQFGPGSENAFSGVATAYSDSVPVLLLPELKSWLK